MELTVNFYRSTKRVNSTRIATGTPALALTDVTLKAPTSILRPTLIVNTAVNPYDLNFAYIDSFKRYYWVAEDGWISLGNDLWQVKLKVDVLASYRGSIGNYETYVLRSSYSKNGDIVDNLYPCEASTTTTVESITSPFATQFKDGCFILGIVNKGNTDLLGGITYYHMTTDEFVAFANYLLSSNPVTSYMGNLANGMTGIMDLPDGQGGTITSNISYEVTLKDDLVKSLVDPFQYVKSVQWFPVNPPGTLVNQIIRCGWWVMGAAIQGAPFDKYNTGMTQLSAITVDVPKHPQVARGTYLNLSPYSRYTLYAGPFGEIPIDSTLLAGTSSLRIDIYIDFITGEACLIANRGTSGFVPVAYVRKKISVDMILTQATTNIAGAAGNLVSGIAGMFTGNLLGSASGIASAAESMLPQSSTTGSVGSLVDFNVPMGLEATFAFVTDTANNEIGSPLCQTVMLKNIPGYIQCQTGTINNKMTYEEQMEVKNFLEGGFFYE